MDTSDLMAQDMARNMRGMESQNSLLTQLLAEQRETNRLLRHVEDELAALRRLTR